MIKDYNDPGVEFRYPIISDMDQRYGLWVNTVGFQPIQPNSSYPLRDHPSGYFFNTQKRRVPREYQLIYIIKGRGVFSSEGTSEKPLCRGHLIVFFPGQWHTYHPYRQTGWNGYYIGFEGSVVDNLMENGFLSKNNQVPEAGLNEELVSLFSRALGIVEVDKMSSQQYFASIVLRMMGMMLSVSRDKIFEVGDIDRKTEQAKIITGENVFNNIDPEELVMRLNISYSWLRKVFRDYTGYASAKYLRELKLREARRLLLSTSQSVKEISFMFAYRSIEHFFASFKERTGFTSLEHHSLSRETDAENEC